ncbi:MAG: hypothetical protein C5B55_06075 [Blastocatellia bacterium]|nr:MAG: hypothetical protein C5B55_06075 [Blastocatellia bacterium]
MNKRGVRKNHGKANLYDLSEKRFRSVADQVELRLKQGRRFKSGLTLEELSKIEEDAHRSSTNEAKTILRLAVTLREALQLEENALALLTLLRDNK